MLQPHSPHLTVNRGTWVYRAGKESTRGHRRDPPRGSPGITVTAILGAYPRGVPEAPRLLMAATPSQPTLDACREITRVSHSPTGRFQAEGEPQRLGPSMNYERRRCLGPEADWKRSALVNAGCPEHLARCRGPERANALAPPSPHHRQPGVARAGDETQPGATSE